MKSYWIESTKNEKRNYPRLKESLSTEVCIIGGGITGITTAYYLAKEGRKVIYLKKMRYVVKQVVIQPLR